MGSDRSLIDVSAHILADDHGLTQIASNAEQKGINWTVWTKNGEKFLVRAKEYVYKEKAPFGADHVRDAMKKDAWLVIYYDDRQQHYLFDPSLVHNTGERMGGRSKRSRNRTWVEVGLTDGVLLSEYLRGKHPRGLDETDREPSNTSLDDFV